MTEPDIRPTPPAGLSPGQRSIWLAENDARLRRHLAFNLFEHESSYWGTEAHSAWDALTEDSRLSWEDKAVEETRRYNAMSEAERRMEDRAALLETLNKNDTVAGMHDPEWEEL